MGLFSSTKHKITFHEVWKALHHVPGLDQKERTIILNALKPARDLGGIKSFEVKETFRRLRYQHTVELDDLERAESAIMRLFG